MKIGSYVFFIIVYIYIERLSESYFCVWRGVVIKSHYFFPFGYLYNPGPFSENIFLPISLQRQFCHKSCDCIWGSLFVDYFVPMVNLSLLAPMPHALNYCSFIISLDIWQCRLCAFSRLPWLLLASSFLYTFYI